MDQKHHYSILFLVISSCYIIATTYRDLNLEALCTTIISWAMLKIQLCPSHIGQMLDLPAAVSPDVLRNASLWITLTVPEVVGTENWLTSNLPFLPIVISD